MVAALSRNRIKHRANYITQFFWGVHNQTIHKVDLYERTTPQTKASPPGVIVQDEYWDAKRERVVRLSKYRSLSGGAKLSPILMAYPLIVPADERCEHPKEELYLWPEQTASILSGVPNNLLMLWSAYANDPRGFGIYRFTAGFMVLTDNARSLNLEPLALWLEGKIPFIPEASISQPPPANP